MPTTTTKFGTLTPHDLPTPPEVAIRIVHACADPAVSGRQLQHIVSQDPALSAELLRVANAPYFGLRNPATKLEHALLVLGQRQLRNIALLFLAREAMRTDRVPELDGVGFWEDALRRAVSARLLAEEVGADPDVAFTVGMLQDIGLLGMFVVFPDLARHWRQMRIADPEARRGMEKELFGATHDQVAQLLAESWGLPDDVAQPVIRHHQVYLDDLDPATRNLCNVATCADWMAAVYTAQDRRLALAHCRQHMSERYALDQARTDELLSRVPEAITDAAQALDIPIDPQVPFGELLAYANRWLIEIHQREATSTARLEAALEERERLAEALQYAYDRMAQLAYFDPLTSLVNRRRFEDLFCGEIARHTRSGHELSLIVLDIDGFKTLNDTYGHPFGDTVLQAVAEVVKRTLRISDVAARLGGDEISLLLPETDAEGGRIAAERLRVAMETLRFAEHVAHVRVTTSIGGSTWVGSLGDGMVMEEAMTQILGQADQAMYRSKESGRNQVSWVGLN